MNILFLSRTDDRIEFHSNPFHSMFYPMSNNPLFIYNFTYTVQLVEKLWGMTALTIIY